MDIGKITAKGLFDEEEEEEEDQLSYGTSVLMDLSEEKVDEARRRKAEHVYETFVRPVFNGSGEELSEEDILEAVRPPYNQDEIDDALEYGMEEGSIVYDEVDDVYRWDS